MSQKSKSVEKQSFMKPSRKPFPQNGVAVLFKSRDAAPETAKGIKVLPLNSQGQPDWTADAYVIWFNELDMLRKGTMPRIGVFFPFLLQCLFINQVCGRHTNQSNKPKI